MALTTLPTELLSEIAELALLSSTLNEGTDEKLTQPKPRKAFRALKGFGTSSKAFRVIFLRLWFAIFKIYSVNDITEFLQSCSLSSDEEARFVRQIYLDNAPGLSPTHFKWFTGLKAISYPFTAAPLIPMVEHWPNQLHTIEVRDLPHHAILTTCVTLACDFPRIRRLRLSNGPYGPYGPIPGDFKSATELSEAYSKALQPLQELQHLSLDMDLTDSAEQQQQQLQQQLQRLARQHWLDYKDTTVERETQVTMAFARKFPGLKTVEWSIWLIQDKERSQKCTINRGLLEENLSVEPCTLPNMINSGVA